MAKTKKSADVEALESLDNASIPVEVPQGVTMNDLLSTIKSLQSQIEEIKNPAIKSRITQKTREHIAFLREWNNENEEPVGIITKISSVREVEDKESGVARFKGLCTINVLDPITQVETVHKNVDYLNLLNSTKKVPANIVDWKKHRRVEFIRYGVKYDQLKEDEVVGDANFPFEHEIQEDEFTLTIIAGAFKGYTFVNNGTALNI